MEHNINISVNDLGRAAGTLGWLNARLATARVEITPNKKAILSAYLVYTHPDTGDECKKWVASIIQDPIKAEESEMYGFIKIKDNIKYAFCGRGRCMAGSEYRDSIFDTYLTDAAYDKVSELREKIISQLADTWSNN